MRNKSFILSFNCQKIVEMSVMFRKGVRINTVEHIQSLLRLVGCNCCNIC